MIIVSSCVREEEVRRRAARRCDGGQCCTEMVSVGGGGWLVVTVAVAVMCRPGAHASRSRAWYRSEGNWTDGDRQLLCRPSHPLVVRTCVSARERHRRFCEGFPVTFCTFFDFFSPAYCCPAFQFHSLVGLKRWVALSSSVRLIFSCVAFSHFPRTIFVFQRMRRLRPNCRQNDKQFQKQPRATE